MFAMELVTGAPLTERLRSGAVPVSEALALAVRDECRWPTCGCVSMDSKPYALASASPSRAQGARGMLGWPEEDNRVLGAGTVTDPRLGRSRLVAIVLS